MSDTVSEEYLTLSWVKDNNSEDFALTVGSATIIIDELRIRPSSNMVKPYRVLGKGGSKILLTRKQTIKLLAEYLRFTIQEELDYEQADTSHEFYFRKKK